MKTDFQGSSKYLMTFVKMAIITIPSWQAGSLELGQKAPNLPPLKNITKWPCQLTPKFKNDYLFFSWCPTQSGEWRFHFFYGGPSRRKNITARTQMCWTYFHFSKQSLELYVFGVFSALSSYQNNNNHRWRRSTAMQLCQTHIGHAVRMSAEVCLEASPNI